MCFVGKGIPAATEKTQAGLRVHEDGDNSPRGLVGDEVSGTQPVLEADPALHIEPLRGDQGLDTRC